MGTDEHGIFRQDVQDQQDYVCGRARCPSAPNGGPVSPHRDSYFAHPPPSKTMADRKAPTK